MPDNNDGRSNEPQPVDRLIEEATSGSAYRSLFANRNYRRFFGAGLISSLGDWTGFVALQALVAALYAGNPRFALFGLGGVMMARLLPSLVFGPVAGVLADRYDRKRLMVAVDVLRGMLFVGIALADNLSTFFLLTLLVESAALLYLSAKDATLPTIVHKRHLTQANQLNLLLAYGTLPAGALVVSVLTFALTRAGLTSQDATVVALLVNAASFFIAAAFTAGLRIPDRRRDRSNAADQPGVVEELREGLRFIREFPVIRSLILGVVGVFFGAGVVVTLGPEYVASVMDRPPVEWSGLLTLVGAGLIAGIAISARLERSISRERLFPLSLAGAGAVTAVLAWVPTFTIAQALGSVLGFMAGIAFVTGYSLLQAQTTDDTRGRTFAAFYTSTRISLFTALGVTPFVAAAIASPALVISGKTYVINGIRLTMFLGALVALWSAIHALRGINNAVRNQPDRPIRMGPTAPTPSHPGGLFIAFEGVEGSGKSTQVRALVQALEEEGRNVVVTREPGGPPVAERIRDVLLDPNAAGMDPRTETLLYAAARAEHVQCVVGPALESGQIVVCDRFIDSSLAYQGFARELGDADVFEINRWAVGGLLPDVVVLLDLSADEGLRRVHERARRRRADRRERDAGPQPVRLGDWRSQGEPDRLEAENLDFHRRVAKGYRELARRDRRRFVVVDAEADAPTVARQVRAALHPWLPLPVEETRRQPVDDRSVGEG